MKTEKKDRADLPPIRITRALFDRIEAEVNDSFGSLKLSDVVRKRLTESYNREPGALPLTELESVRDEGRKIDNEMKLMKLRQARGELVRADAVVLAYRRMITPIRQALLQVEYAATDLTDEQRAELVKWREDTLTNLSAATHDRTGPRIRRGGGRGG